MNKKNNKFFTTPAFTGLFFLLVSQTSFLNAQNPLTLSKAVENALSNRKNIGAGKMDLEIRKLQTSALYKKYLPQISLEYIYQYNPILPTSILPIGIFNPLYPAGATKAVQFGTKWSQNAGINIQQPLLDVSIKKQINEFTLQEKITRLDQSQNEYQLTYDVALSFINVLIQKKQMESAVVDSIRTWLSLQLQNNRFINKRLLKLDLNKAQINHNNSVQKFKDALSLWTENKMNLLYLTGEENLEKSDLNLDTAFFKEGQFTIENFTNKLDSIPEIQALSFQESLTDLQTKSEKAKYIPVLSLKGFLGASQYTNNFNPIESGTWFGSSYLGLDLKLPITIGEDKYRKLKQLEFKKKQYEANQEDKLSGYRKDFLTAKLRMKRMEDEIKNLSSNILLSQESIKLIRERFTEEQESASTLNTEETSLQSLEADYQTHKKQVWLYYLDYLRSSGLLSKFIK